jgi:probable HAF family extracellular repeat protein
VGTLALDINASGTIVGRYLAPTTPLTTHGFIRTPDGQITTFDYPGSSFTAAVGINARGDIVGQYAVPTAPKQRHGYLLSAGVFTSFDPEGSTFTNVLGINDRGDIVGRFCTLAVCGLVGTGDFHGFQLSDGQFAPVTFPGSAETDAWKINSRGQIAGGFVTTAGEEHAFVTRDGAYTELTLPIDHPVSMDNGGENSRGDVVGLFCDGAPPCVIVPTGTHGFFLGNEGFETIDYPGATATSAIGINAGRDIVGGWFDAKGSIHGYLLTRVARD